MSRITLNANQPLIGTTAVPGDKSISHRAVIIGSLAHGKTHIHNFLPGNDCLATVNIMRQLGVKIEQVSDTELIVLGQGLHSLTEPSDICDAHNSGTTMRLLSGVLAGQPFYTVLTGDGSLRFRPMKRITQPLQEMGAQIWGRKAGTLAPLSITGKRPLKAIHHYPKVASAQVKSAVLLAGLYANNRVCITEPSISRDHTERMLTAFGAKLMTKGRTVTIEPDSELIGKDITVPGDFSSAAYIIAAALIVPGSQVSITNVGINPTRTGLLSVLSAMGADIKLTNHTKRLGEDVADIHISHSDLQAVKVEEDIIPKMIDEIPILAVLACLAEGTTTIEGVAELRHKETDRLAAAAHELSKAGFAVEEGEDFLKIQGGSDKMIAEPIDFNHYNDHRMAMSLAILSMALKNEHVLTDMDVCEVSFPNFLKTLQQLGVEVAVDE